MNIQQLRAQIAALQDATMDENKNFRSDYDEGKFDALSAVDALLDSLQEEPVSDDLEKAASRYAKEEYNRKSPATLPDRCIGCYAPLMYAFKAGAEWQKNKMMEDAVDGVVAASAGALIATGFVKSEDVNVKFGDKIKIIVVKED